MKVSPVRGMAAWLISSSNRLAPEARRSWVEAMRAELDHIDGSPAQLGFAVGCAWTALLLAMTSLPSALRLSRAAVAFGLTAVAVLGFAGSTAGLLRTLAAGHPVAVIPTALLYTLVLAYAGGGVVIRRWGGAALAAMAGVLFAAHATSLALLSGHGAGGTQPGTPLSFYRALSLEGAGMWGLLLTTGLVLAVLEHRQRQAQRSSPRAG